MKLTVEHLSRPRDGEHENGDAVVVRRDGSSTLFVVIDALGHGAHAAAAAQAAVEHLADAPLAAGARALMEGLHLRLRGTRGAAAMLCLVDGERLEGCGVGNVDLRAVRGKVPVVLTPGILGSQLNRLRVFDGRVAPGDRLLVFSDGLTGRIDTLALGPLRAADVCRTMMDRYRRSHDDATILVADVEA